MKLHFGHFFNRLPTGGNFLFHLPDVWAKPLPPPPLMESLKICFSWPLCKHELDSIIRVNLLQLTPIKTKPNLLPACGIG